MSETPVDSQPAKPPGDIVAKAGRYFRNIRYGICTAAFLLGLYFAYDGWIGYPGQRYAFEHMSEAERAKSHSPPTELDIRLQKQIALGLIPLAPILLGWFLYRSRGEYRLSGTTLFAPGHPPIPFDAIVGVDKSKLERKGIVHVDYKLDDAAPTHRLTLDDFVYEQEPTDKIIDVLLATLQPDDAEEADEPPSADAQEA